MQKKKYDYEFRILLLGDSRVGKTSLSKSFMDNYFTDYYYNTYGKK
jgi:GTPase SAR1 family protein